MSKMVRGLLGLALLLGAWAFAPASALGAQPTPRAITPQVGNYRYACALSDNNEHAYLDKTGISNVYSAFADVVYLRDTASCYLDTTGRSFVFPVNIQGPGIGCAAQVGWGSVDGSLYNHWYVTLNDNSCSVSVPSGWPDPVEGHSYHFTINQTGTQWQYVLTDRTAGGPNYYAYASRHGGGAEIWSGFEVWNDNDQMGGAGTAQYIYDVGWKTSINASALYMTSSTVYLCCGTGWNSYWHRGSTHDPDGHAEIYAYTSLH